MAGGCDYKCNHCGYKVSTSSPHEFYRDSEGNRKIYGHPVPFSEEAMHYGVKGLSMMSYCPKCDAVRDVVMVEFDGPTGVLDAFKSGLDVMRAYESIGGLASAVCPECQTRLLDNLISLECPRCKKGVFELATCWYT